MKKLQVLKNKKGFTLIEIIVVLIILAILAAAGIPSMIGFIDDSRGKAYIAEARVGLVAAQVVVTEKGGTAPSELLANPITDSRFLELVKGVNNVNGFSGVTVSSGQVTQIAYRSSAATTYYTVTIKTSGETTVVKTTP